MALALLASAVAGIAGAQPRAAERTAATPVDPAMLDARNEAEWRGDWTNVIPGNLRAQTFVPKSPELSAVEVDLLAANRGRGGDTLTLRLRSSDGRALAAASLQVEEGFEGWLRFPLAQGGHVSVEPGAPLKLELEDTGKAVFGWKYGEDSYPGGTALMNEMPRRPSDFRFRVLRARPAAATDAVVVDGGTRQLKLVRPPAPSPAPRRAGVGAVMPGARRVGGAIREPRKLRDVRPVYPDSAKRSRVQGLVILECAIGTDGKVASVGVLRGIAGLNDAAIEAVRQWEYEPTLLDGVAVPVIMTVTVNFKIS